MGSGKKVGDVVSELSGHHRRSYITFAFCERETSSQRSDHLSRAHKAIEERIANFSPLVPSSSRRTVVQVRNENW